MFWFTAFVHTYCGAVTYSQSSVLHICEEWEFAQMAGMCTRPCGRMDGMTLHSALAIIHTTKGDINVRLFGFQAPKTVANFSGLATGEQAWKDPRTGEDRHEPLYQDVTFHRVIPDFMIQGGDPLGDGRGGPGYVFDDEIDPELTFDKPYLLAMANAGKQFGHGTNGSQFFITVAPTPWLNGNHTIFGEVADDPSKAVVDAIVSVPTQGADKPVDDVLIKSIDIEAA